MTPGPRPSNGQLLPAVPVTADDVDLAYEAFAALRRASQEHPDLGSNRFFTALQDTAYARFLLHFEAL